MTGGHGRSRWDREFRFSDILPDFTDWLEWRDRTSRDVSRTVSFERLAYGGHDRQWVETATFEGAASRIVPVFFHGGYWRSLSAEDHRCVLPGLSALGSRCANAEYRLMPEFRLNDLVTDAVAALKTIADRYSGDAKFLLVGHSAGAHLAISAATTGDFASRLAGVVGVSGVYDLAPVARSFLQDEIHLSDAEIDAHSLVGTGLDVPLLCVVGGGETDEFKRQAKVMAEKSGSGHLTVRGAHHLSILADLCAGKSPLLEALRHWADGADFPEEVDTVSS